MGYTWVYGGARTPDQGKRKIIYRREVLSIMVAQAHAEKQTGKAAVMGNSTVDYSTMNAAEIVAAMRNADTRNVNATAEIDEQGFTVLRDKDKLIGVPFTIVYATKEVGDNGLYYSIRVYTDGGKLLKFGDGGTGIPEQLKKFADDGGTARNIRCPRGLRVSRYQWQGKPAATYYLDEEDVS
jgi:hypothetical protein